MTVGKRDVVEVLDLFDAGRVDAWLDGGWGVDALLGEQTRPHYDLDLIVRVEDVPRLGDVLRQGGFDLAKEVPGSNVVWRDERDREIDVHPVLILEDGSANYRMEGGGTWSFPAGSLDGIGSVAGRRVSCLTADAQMLCHAQGYEPDSEDIRDMRLLHVRLGTRLLGPYVA